MRFLAAALLLATSLLPAANRCSTCQRDSRGHIKRSTVAKSQFRNQHPCPATGRTRGACPGFVIDHVVPLKRGGADSPRNMQWQTTAEAKAKDRVE
jgi:5-methylcytosine-specific restriction endonuclease McrA